MQADIITAADHQIADRITVAADSVQHALDAAVAAEHALIKSTARLAEAEVDFKRAVDRMQETKKEGDNDYETNFDKAHDAAEEACDAAAGMQKRQRKADQASGSNGI